MCPFSSSFSSCLHPASQLCSSQTCKLNLCPCSVQVHCRSLPVHFNLFCDAAGAYQRLWPVYKRRAQAAMRALLQAIASKPFLMQALVPRLVSMLLAHTVRPAESQTGAGGPQHACLLRCRSACQYLVHTRP